ncbi:hypothetical protein C8046_17155 [Serinibacter arcticus]|uniref:Hemagglutinin-related protein n=1 Tax=Serinibacter arcticus TaxID=1655435 RepID=A0A2U1ZYQ4_9MICO|nr:hypothetical protein [Serinibacter arcticus]PWD52111.1 hypothetical protein C8046_17155 [Serinibacter arcticus]
MTLLRRLLTAGLSVAVAAAVLVGLPGLPGVPEPTAAAAEGSLFDPGNIVSDAVFYDSGAMSVAEVQSFLELRGRNCVAGEQPCLKDYRSDSRTWAAESGLCQGYTGRSQQTAAEIIVGVAQSCGLNPRSLLVLLEKEQALVGRTRPTSRAYQIATGFGCPDTAPCNTEYYGFFNQVYRAARQFQIYQSNPTRYGYQAGRTNYIQWNPNAACGGTNVYIENQATAALYIYTPYQPNAAALRNLYGTGDSCSSYGNRNFWRLFTDWFGDPRAGGSFVRTASDPTVWLVNGATRHRVTSMATLANFSRLGDVATVSSSYVDRLRVGSDLGPMVLDSSTGNVLFVDTNIALRMSTCTQVADFGGACSSLPTMSGAQVQRLYAGPAMTNGYVTTDGRRWYVSNGTRREVLDEASLSANGLPTTSVRLSLNGVAALPVGAPVLRDRVVIAERWTSTGWIWADGRRHEIPMAAVAEQSTLAALPTGVLDAASLAQLPPGLHATGAVAGPDGRRYLLTTTGLSPLTSASTVTSTAPSWSASFIASFPVTPSVPAAANLRPDGSSTVHRVTNAVARPVATWSDLVTSSGTANPPVHTVPPTLFRFLATTGAPTVAPGELVKAADSPDVFLATDVNTVIHVDDLAVPAQLGLRSIRTIPAASIASSTRLPGRLSPVVQCSATSFVATGGRLQAVAVTQQRGLPVTPFGAHLCATTPRLAGTAVAPVLLKTAQSADLYYVANGVRQHVRTWAAVLRLTGGAAPTVAVVGSPTLQSVPEGSPLS